MGRRDKSESAPRRRTRLHYALRRRLGIAAVLVVLAGVVAADRAGLFDWVRLERRAPTREEDVARYHARRFRVVNVVDGDTFDIAPADWKGDRTRIRLWGVDTPETVKPNTPVQHYGPEASRFTAAACLGKEVEVVLDASRGTRGRRGRLLAYILLPDGTMLNRELVRLGYAYADPRYPHEHKREFARLQEEARRAGRGLWAEVTRGDLPYYYRDTLEFERE